VISQFTNYIKKNTGGFSQFYLKINKRDCTDK